MNSRMHTSLIVQSAYVVLTALQLIFVPNMLLSMFGMPPTSEVWIKVLGIVLLPLSFIYYAVSKYGSKEAVTSTVFSRLFVGLGFVLLYFTNQAPISIILFAGIDILTAVWTWFELQSNK